jgi:hypothetical protein
MNKSDLNCPECGRGYRRIELTSRKGTPGKFRCLLCEHVLAIFDGSTEVAIRLTVQPEIRIKNPRPIGEINQSGLLLQMGATTRPPV